MTSKKTGCADINAAVCLVCWCSGLGFAHAGQWWRAPAPDGAPGATAALLHLTSHSIMQHCRPRCLTGPGWSLYLTRPYTSQDATA